jgi:hypothetical protein
MLFQVDFTQAAFLLQGTANVYSKKVEYLYQYVLKMLHLLASQVSMLFKNFFVADAAANKLSVCVPLHM